MKFSFLAALLPWIFVAPGCAPETSSSEKEEETASIQQPEPWSNRDDPWGFSHTLERRAAALPRSGEASPIPWPGNYWPTWEDSINDRWNGPNSQSPAKKYELAFGGSGVEDAVSRHHGIDSLQRAKTCSAQDECKSGEACAKRNGATSGRCVPTWFGMCHGWAAASVLFPEPKRSVLKNGVTFEIQDIKALLSLAHHSTASRFLSLRCNADEAEGAITYDEYGRPAPACRDTNAGTFHLVLTNVVGIHKDSFIEDGTFDDQVWNRPIRGYTIVSQTPVAKEEALRLLDVPVPGGSTPDGGAPDAGSAPAPVYIFNRNAASFLYVKVDVAYVTGASASSNANLASRIDDFTQTVGYEYVLELDARGTIIGGEWVGSSKRNHPDFLWLPVEASAQSQAGGKISYNEVHRLAKASVSPVQPGRPAPPPDEP